MMPQECKNEKPKLAGRRTRESISEKMTFDLRPKEIMRVNQLKMKGRGIPSEKHMQKGPGWRKHDIFKHMKQSPFGNHHSTIILGTNHQWILIFEDESLIRNKPLHSLSVSSHKIFFSYKRKNGNIMQKKPDRHHSK